MLLLGAVVLTAQQVPSSKGVNFYSIQKEIEIGRVLGDQMRESVTILHDPQINQYLGVLGSELSGTVGETHFPYSFAVFRGAPLSSLMAFPLGPEGKDLEAIAVAGGAVFVQLQLVDKLETEPELAAVLAHAIAHIALRHGARTATRSALANLSTHDTPRELDNAGSVLVPIAFLKFARVLEAQADALAVHILAQAGYDPDGLLSYLRKLPAPQSKLFAAHPDPEARIRAVEGAIQLLPPRTYRTDSGRFAEWKRAVASAGAP